MAATTLVIFGNFKVDFGVGQSASLKAFPQMRVYCQRPYLGAGGAANVAGSGQFPSYGGQFGTGTSGVG
jgi:hypothetical protein